MANLFLCNTATIAALNSPGSCTFNNGIGEAKHCCVGSLSYWPHKPPESNRSGAGNNRDYIRHLVVHWERLVACFEAFLAIATIHIWIHRLIVG